MKRACLSVVAVVLFSGFSAFSGGPIYMSTKGIFAHRGASKLYPENTSMALRAAVASGAQGVEIDIRFTKDQQLVLMHDSKVNRTTDGKGYVRNLTLAEIKKLDAGVWKHKAFAGERVPTFREALAVLPKNIWINLHIKESETLLEVAKIIKATRREHQSLFAIFAPDIEALRKFDPNLKIINMTRTLSNSTYVDNTLNLGADGMQFYGEFSMVKPNDVTKAHNAGLMTFNSGINNPKKIEKLFKMGVDFVLADDPVAALKVFHSVTNFYSVGYSVWAKEPLHLRKSTKLGFMPELIEVQTR
ncbi:MAG: glycerophosphodiester phosphodiesterase family protein [Bdellovibrionota bacterium]